MDCLSVLVTYSISSLIQHAYRYWCTCCHKADLSDVTYATVISNPVADPATTAVVNRLPPSYSSLFTDPTFSDVIRNPGATSAPSSPQPPARPRRQRRRDTLPTSTERAPLSLYGPDHLASRGFIVRDSSKSRLTTTGGDTLREIRAPPSTQSIRPPRTRGATSERSALTPTPYRHALYTESVSPGRDSQPRRNSSVCDFGEECLSYCSRAYSPSAGRGQGGPLAPIPLRDWPYCEYYARHRFQELLALAQRAQAVATDLVGSRTYPEPSAPPPTDQPLPPPRKHSIAIQVDRSPGSPQGASAPLAEWC